jgi:hypothetical protein
MSEGESTPAVPPRRSKFGKILLGVVAVLAVCIAAGRVYYRYTYPYGWSHACSKGLSLGLYSYAEDHSHWFPYGEKTPEASLSLLYQYDTNTALWVLGGKYISRETVEATFERDGKLSPTTCGWHYIEGLRNDDPPEIAIAWDKVVGLGHNGERGIGLMHEVVNLGGSTFFISKKAWPEFLVNEKKFLTDVIHSRSSNAPPIRWSDEESLGPNLVTPKDVVPRPKTAADTSPPPSNPSATAR